MRNSKKNILHTAKTKTAINKTQKTEYPITTSPPPKQNIQCPHWQDKNIEGKGTPLNITAVEVVVAGAKLGAERAGPAWTAAAIE